MFLEEWFAEKFVTPLCHYYTLEATITYGIILALAVIGIYKLLKNLKIKIDKNFFLALVPFIVFGGWTRALLDHNLYQGWWWCSPPIYFLVFLITITSLLLSLKLEKKLKIPYYKITFSIGIIFLLYNLTLTSITNWTSAATVLGLAATWAAIFFGVHKLKPKILSAENAAIMSAHLLDASATFTALTYYGYYEQHVLPSFLIGIAGPWIMFPLKIIVVGGVLWIIDKETDDPYMKNFLKIIIFILGLALGIRDLLTVSMV